MSSETRKEIVTLLCTVALCMKVIKFYVTILAAVTYITLPSQCDGNVM